MSNFDANFPITDIPSLRLLANHSLLEEVVRRANAYTKDIENTTLDIFESYRGATWHGSSE